VWATVSVAQLPEAAGNRLGDGISIRGGLGHLAIRDQYISDEKYSGTLPSFGLSWLRSDTSSAYRLGMDYQSSSTIRNNNVSAQVTQTVLDLDFLHAVGRFSVLAHDVFPYVGPSAEIYLYSRQQHIANGGNALFNAYSFAMFFSLDVNSTLVVPLSSEFSAEVSARLALLAIGGRLVDFHDENARFFKLVSVFSGLRGQTELLLSYALTDVCLLKAGYRFAICQSSSWDYLLSASDNIVLSVTVQI